MHLHRLDLNPSFNLQHLLNASLRSLKCRQHSPATRSLLVPKAIARRSPAPHELPVLISAHPVMATAAADPVVAALAAADPVLISPTRHFSHLLVKNRV